ncbi:CheR family methyltransferase [Geomonas sp.]|uniref:CheR family methyltransferase n=1 Tax=Geomonas sp. TaxID=2651584 RepID=UPI002B498C7B|nr:CheR family methyltransferase [Geomonas sp.]HJV33942.1 CheR family methyltransferase [Geomonas sp.]
MTEEASPKGDGSAPLSEELLCAVLETVKNTVGHDFGSYKRSTLLRTVARRMAANGLLRGEEYLALLDNSPREARTLCRESLIQVTGFFRDVEAFAAVEREVIPRLFEGRDPEQPVRIWHPCCATGEEAYSMAMLVREYLDSRGLPHRVRLFATDLDEDSIVRARSGLYTDEVVAGLSGSRLNAFFTRTGSGWQASGPLREMIVFAPHSLIKDPPFSCLDLLVCRNFLIYLLPEMQKRLIALFHQALNPGGFLFLGSAETANRCEGLFSTLDQRWRIFQRQEPTRRPPLTLLPEKWTREPRLPESEEQTSSDRRPGRVTRVLPAAERVDALRFTAASQLAERYAPPFLVVDQQGSLLEVSPRAARYLTVPPGEAAGEVSDLVLEELRAPLRAALAQVLSGGEAALFPGIPLPSAAGGGRVDLAVEPLEPPAGEGATVLFAALPLAGPPPDGPERVQGGGGKRRVRELEERLSGASRQLWEVARQLEGAREGYLSVNEELLFVNEEFHCANQELERSRGELRALNEGLIALNLELQGTVDELHEAHADMENLLASSRIATLFLDRELRVKRYTPALAEIFPLTPAELGLTLAEVADTLSWPGLAADATGALDSRLPVEREVALPQSGHFLLRALPYLDRGGEVDGVVLTLVDISERKRMEDALLVAKQQWERTFDAVPDLIAILDDRQRIVRANRAMSERLAIPAEGALEPICYHCVHEALEPVGACPHLLTMQDGLQHSVEIHDERLGADFLVTTSPLLDEEGRRSGSVHVAHDITQRKKTEEVLRRSEAEFRTLADAIPQLAWMAGADGWVYWYNQRWYEYTGASEEEHKGWGWQSMHDPELLPAVLERWRQSIATGEDFDMTFPLKGADGGYRSFLTRVLPVRDEQGRVSRWFGTSTDVTERIRGEQALHHGNLRLNLMARTAAELLATDAPRRMLESICRKVMEFLECHVFFNYLVEEETGCLLLNAYAGVDKAQAAAVEWLDYGAGICGVSARDACPVLAEQIPESGDPRTALLFSWGITAYACHPLIAQGRVLGTVAFGTRARTRFAEEEVSLMKWVADLLSIAMERKRMEASLRAAHDQLEQRVRERTEELASAVATLQGEIAERERAEESLRRLNRLYAVLSEVDQAIVRARDRRSLFRDVCRVAVAHGGFLLARVGLLEPSGGKVVTAAANGATAYLADIEGLAEAGQEGPTALSIREGSFCICNDFQKDPRTRPWREQGKRHGIRASASIAIREEERVVGALTLYAAERDCFDRQQVALLQQMADEISFALDNFRREARRRDAELALQQETLERLRAVEALREQERMLIQQSRQAALGDMIGNIAHQWRQPLNTLGLMLQELAMCYDFGEFSKEHLTDTVENSMQVLKHMSQTIDDFRNFFRPEKEKVSFRVRQVIERAVAIVEASLKEHRIDLELSTVGDPLIEGYPNEYSQVILNVLLNARDACTERGVSDPLIRVRVAEAGGRSLVSIEDNAGGIPEEILERIFEPYFTTKGPDKGTGVGLYMSKVITEKNMNGRLSARNRGQGAEFTIEV